MRVRRTGRAVYVAFAGVRFTPAKAWTTTLDGVATSYRVTNMPNDRPPRWRLAASSRFPRNARKQHLPKATIRRLNIDLTQARKSRYRRLPTEEREPLCGTHGEYKRIHYTYADALGLPPCAGCFDGVNLHK